MPAETLERSERPASEQTPSGDELEVDEALRAEAVTRIQRERTFRVHALVIGIVTPLVGFAWMLTEYYTAHTHHMWPSAFADAPAERPGVWSTWFFYFVGVMVLVLAIDAYKAYAKPYLNRRPTQGEIEREVTRLASRRR